MHEVHSPAAPRIRPASHTLEPSGHRELARRLVAGERDAVEYMLVDALDADAAPGALASQWIQPAMARVGELWAEGRISVAQEHLASALCQTVMLRLFARMPAAAPHGRRAVLACVPGNRHALGVQLLADSMELAGWTVDLLGADPPLADLLDFVGESAPDLIGLSTSMTSHLPALRETVAGIRAGPAAGVVIAAGGNALQDRLASPAMFGVDRLFPCASHAVTGLEVPRLT